MNAFNFVLGVLFFATGAFGMKVGGVIGWALAIPCLIFLATLLFAGMICLVRTVRFKYFHPYDRALREEAKRKD